MASPRPCPALYEQNLAKLRTNFCGLHSRFLSDMQSQADADSREQTNLAARLPPDAFQRTLNADDAHAYNISRDVPGYVGIRYIMEYVRVNRPFLWERSLDDPSLLLPLPRDAPLAPRGAPRTGSRPRLHGGPPLGGACSQQISVGINPVLGAFADALAGGKVDIFECAAQANIEFEAGKLYEFDELFDATAYPFSKVGDCCGAHHRAVARQLRQARGQLSNLVDIRKSSSGLSRPLTRATVKSSARTRPIKRLAKGLSKELGGASEDNPTVHAWLSSSTSIVQPPSSLSGPGVSSSWGAGASSSWGAGASSLWGAGPSSSPSRQLPSSSSPSRQLPSSSSPSRLLPSSSSGSGRDGSPIYISSDSGSDSGRSTPISYHSIASEGSDDGEDFSIDHEGGDKENVNEVFNSEIVSRLGSPFQYK